MKIITLLLLVSSASFLFPQNIYFPPTTGAEWQKMSFTEAGWDSSKADTLYSFLEQQNTKAFLVLKNGKIVIEKYFGSFAVDSVWYWASAGKTLTAFLIGIALQQGALSLDDSVSKYLGTGWTSAPPEKERLITIRHQLTMSSGLDDNVADPYCTLPECLQYLSDAGTRWAYHNGPYTLLDSVFTAATGSTLNQFVQSTLKPKTGINGVFLRQGYNNVFFSNARNMARFGLLILNKGVWDTTVLLQDTAYYNAMIQTSQQINKSYGYLWWLNGKDSYMIPQSQFVFPGFMNAEAPAEMFSALGKNGQIINIIPSEKLVMIRMGEAPDNSLVPFLLNTDIWRLFAPILEKPTAVHEQLSVSPAKRVLLNNYPNPFNPITTISFTLPQQSYAELTLYTMHGELVKTLRSGTFEAGEHTVHLDATDIPSGIYLCRLRTLNTSVMHKIVLLR